MSIDKESADEQARLAAIAYVKKHHRDPWKDAGGEGKDHINTFLAGVAWRTAQTEIAKAEPITPEGEER